MKITLPHVNTAWVPLKTFFDKHVVECIVPPKNSNLTLTLGAGHSPDGLCVPYKILLGNMIQALELGADTVIDVSGPGLCRLGYYAMLHESALRDLGFKFKFLVFDWQEEQIIGIVKFLRRLVGGEKISWAKVVGDVKFGIQQLILLDDLQKRVHHIRARELTLGASTQVWHNADLRVSKAQSPGDLRRVRKELFSELNAIPINKDSKPLRVHILGEFYMVLEPFANMELEEELGKRGVEVTRAHYWTDWCKIWLFLELIGMSHGRKVKKTADPYLRIDVSGHAQQTVGETILHQKEGYDGVIQVLPFTCMPEIVAQNIMPKVTRDYQIPMLSLIFDEQTGKASFLTRLEAFIDLMEHRRSQRTAVSA